MSDDDTFYLNVYAFHWGIDQIERLMKSSKAELERTIEEELAKLEHFNANPGLYAIEYPDDVDPSNMPDFGDYVRWHIANAELQLQTVYQAFLMAIYHHWERSVILWTGADMKYSDRYDWLQNKGVDFDKDGMEVFRTLMQAIKHENSDPLFKLKPNLFPKGEAKHDGLMLAEADVADLIKSVRSAGPRQPTLRNSN